MATKSITITNEAYERLANLKDKNESFSDIIKRITAKYSLLDLVGILTKKEADELRNNIKELRERLRNEVDEVSGRL